MEDQDTKATNGSHIEENGSPVKPDPVNSSVNDENQQILINSPGPKQGGVNPSLLKTSPAIGSVKISRVSLFNSPDLQTPSSPGSENSEARRSIRGSVGSMDNDDVLCDSCIDDKKKAVKSCLVCQTSFCEPHLKPHLEGAAFRDHKLLDPIRDFEARKCQLHSKTMELFCQTDQTCICYLCMFQEHKNHNTVTVEAEKYVKEVRTVFKFSFGVLFRPND